MGDAKVSTTKWRFVERGRVVSFSTGPFKGRLAAIVDIIDHKRILVHGPSPQTSRHVPRQPVALSDVALTHIVIPKFPKSAGNGHVTALWEKHEVETWHTKAGHAISRAKSEKRRQLTDFERFKVMRLRKQARFEVKKTLAKARATTKAS